jgi:protein-S-isoprenylcysteine O-methyltransferase Ste14
MKTEFLVFLGLFLGGIAIRMVYEALKKTGRIDPRNKIIFTIVFLAMCLMWASWFSLCPSDPSPLAMPTFIHWIGFAVFVAGLILAFGALIQLRGVENIDHLVTRGIFARFRHPMYLGFIFWILGWAIFHGAAVSLAIGLIAVANIFYWRHLEEIHLEAAYGDVYKQYRRQTWF